MAKMIWTSNEESFLKLKEQKKNKLSEHCQEDILSGFNVNIDGEEYRASYDSEAQINLQERFALFENNIVNSIVMTLHKDGEVTRMTVNKEQFMHIYLSSVLAKESKISYLRDTLYPLLHEASSEEELEEIKWEYNKSNEDSSIIELDESNTLGKKITKTQEDNKRMQQSLSMTNSGLLELTLLTMMGGN